MIHFKILFAIYKAHRLRAWRILVIAARLLNRKSVFVFRVIFGYGVNTHMPIAVIEQEHPVWITEKLHCCGRQKHSSLIRNDYHFGGVFIITGCSPALLLKYLPSCRHYLLSFPILSKYSSIARLMCSATLIPFWARAFSLFNCCLLRYKLNLTIPILYPRYGYNTSTRANL